MSHEHNHEIQMGYPYEEHAGEGSQYLRDMILGINDGIVSTYLLVVGVVAGGLSSFEALLAALTGALAGCISMGLGEYLATKSQSQVVKGDVEIEKTHFKYHRRSELEQLRQFLTECNIKDELQEEVVDMIGYDDEILMKFMMAFEFGVQQEDGERNPLVAMYHSGRLFLAGALPSIIPFIFIHDGHKALGLASALVGIALFSVGAWKTKTTQGVWWKDGLENLLLGAVGGGISYGIGVAFDHIV